MDLGAYAQIENLEEIAKVNGIEVPRLRGYRLMKDEEPISKEDIEKWKEECAIDVAQDLCEAKPFWSNHPWWYESSYETDYIKDYYLVKNPDKEERGYQKYIGIRWDKIHGWKRKRLKFEIKKQKRRIQEQYDMWNRYAGKDGILYIHARIGGNNWKDFGVKANITEQPWYLERVDDCFDSTYCDIYAKIKEN